MKNYLMSVPWDLRGVRPFGSVVRKFLSYEPGFAFITLVLARQLVIVLHSFVTVTATPLDATAERKSAAFLTIRQVTAEWKPMVRTPMVTRVAVTAMASVVASVVAVHDRQRDSDCNES